jgi:DNA polymerase III subunit delta
MMYKMIVTLTGANDYLRGRALSQRVTAFIAAHDDMAVERLDGEEASADRLREALQSLPFLSERKLVVLREPSKQKAFAEALPEILTTIPETTDVIFYEPKLDKRSTYYKTLKKDTEFQDFADLDARGLAKWAGEYVAAMGGKLNLTDAQILIDRTGASQQLIQSELDKLFSYDAQITRQTIELLVEPTPQSTVFELIDAAFQGKTSRAFELYKEQRALKVEPQAIIAMLAWQLHILAVVKAAGSKAVDEIAKTAKLNPFVVRKSQGLVRKLTLAEIKIFIANLLELDMQLKRTSLDADEALQNYLLALNQKY